jgi:hypothetical protein
MNEYRIGFTVENAYEVVIEATSKEDAREKFEAAYAEDFEQMTGCEFVEVSHTIHNVDQRFNESSTAYFDKDLFLVRGIGADNRISIRACVNENGKPVYRVEETTGSFEVIACEDFFTVFGAKFRANAMLIDEEEVSGIEQERF